MIGLLVLLRLGPVVISQLLLADELTSYLVATGHVAEYYHADSKNPPPVSNWAPAYEWQRFLRIEQDSNPYTVITDLLNTDIHPPLYFLLLRGWTQLFGNSYLVGKLLSWILDVACFGMLVFTGQLLFSSRGFGLLSGIIWLVSPVAVLGGATIRQYSLLTLEVLVFTLLLSRILLHKNSYAEARRLILALLITAVIGLFTHLLFILILLAAVMAIVLTNRTPRHMDILAPFLAVVVGITILSILPDSFGLKIYFQNRYASLGFESNLVGRFALRSVVLLLPLLIPLAAYSVSYFSTRIQHRPYSFFQIDSSDPTLRFLLIMLLVPYVLHGALYLSGFFYPYSVSDHHLLYLTPLVALVSTALLLKFPEPEIGALVILVMVGLFIISATKTGQRVLSIRAAVDLRQLVNYDLLVVDNIQKPQLFNYMDPESTVFAAEQYELIEQPQDWLPRLVSDGGIYVSLVKNGPHAKGNIEGRDRILELIDQTGTYRHIGDRQELGALVSIYLVSK